MISVFCPGPPIGFARARLNRRKGKATHFTPDKQRAYMQKLGWLAEQAMRGHDEYTGPLHMQLRATYAYPASWPEKKKLSTRYKTTKCDLDNIAKIAKDSLNKIVYRDDAQIARLTAEKRYGLPEGLTLTVSPIDEASELL